MLKGIQWRSEYQTTVGARSYKTLGVPIKLLILYLSGRNESGANKNHASEKTKEYVLRQNKYFAGEATC